MHLRPAFLTNVKLKLDKEKLDVFKPQSATAKHSTLKNPSSLVTDIHEVLGDLLSSGGQLLGNSRKLYNSHALKGTWHSLTTEQSKAGVTEALGDSSESAETLQSVTKQMGGEGTPVKNKAPLGQTNTIDHKTEFVAMNSHTNLMDSGTEPNSRGMDAVTAHNATPLELNAEGKRKNIRKSPNHPHSQATCLRQLLFLQLDLIEQQQEQLQTKDKEIDELKADRDTLLARIERMERRLQLLSKEPRDKRLFQPLERWIPDTDDFWDLDLDDKSKESAPKAQALSRGSKVQKRKFSFLDSKAQRTRGKSSKLSPQKSETGSTSPCQRDLRNKETPENNVVSGHPVDQADTEDPQEDTADLPYMTTTEMYLCCWHQPPLSPLHETSPRKEEDVAIPSWRENSVEPLREDEMFDIPESLDDGVFLKRHSKLELDEKRRKRWDIQRIREQRMLQRLQQRMEKKKSGIQEREPEFSSFYPDVEDVGSIVITPFLPVVAFGRPLPNLTQQNFELPWLDERSRCRIENQKKQTPHRTCRK
ncbi:male-specific lethal 1 homolog isoform X2 [Chanos chanos]|uniref:Male-specific lethal 1 homolog isoform X2 n=1 Tax=Chanos chanos TaxID=29144 RepID=A0A6J2VCA4_CHACN|nr:male-specific lethal 1 homolog isoform X2 [Chanos chanos]